jgi:anthranilate synthase component 1
MYFLNLGDFHIVGSSPEILTRLEDGLVTVRPIAGTRQRGRPRKRIRRWKPNYWPIPRNWPNI